MTELLAHTAAPATAANPRPVAATDGELLMRFTRHGDHQAFAGLVESHGPLVWAVCRRVLSREADAEDAFQATFLILARRAGDIRSSDSAAGWLCRVAHRTALMHARNLTRRPAASIEAADVAGDEVDPLDELHRQHTVSVLVEELRALPARYQTPLVLCYLEGRSRSAAAEAMDVTTATIKGRLARGKQMLRSRLARRGVALSVATGVAASAVSSARAAEITSSLAGPTAGAAHGLVTKGTTAAQGATPTAVSLAAEGASAMFVAAVLKPALAAVVLVGVAVGAALALDRTPAGEASGGDAFELVAVAGKNDVAQEADEAGETKIASDTPSAKLQPSTLKLRSSQLRIRTPNGQVAVDAPDGGKVRMELATTEDGNKIIVFKGEDSDVKHAQAMLFAFMQQQRQPGDRDQKADDSKVDEAYALELEYWKLRAEGLEKKANAIENFAKSAQRYLAQQPMGAETSKAYEAEEKIADALLLKADAMHARAKALALKKQMEAEKQAAADRRQQTSLTPTLNPPQAALNFDTPYHDPSFPSLSAAPTISQPQPSSFPTTPSGASVPQAPTFTQPAPQPQVDPQEMLLPGEKVHLVISQKNPQGLDHAYALAIDGSGYISVPGTNRTARIAGPVGDAAEKVLAELRAHHGDYFHAMGMEVEVKRTGESAKGAVFSSPPVSDAASDALPQPKVDPDEMYLPGDVLRITITQDRPKKDQWTWQALIDNRGRINVPKIGRTVEGAGSQQDAPQRVLDQLRGHYGTYFEPMGFDVKVERVEEEAADEAADPAADPTTAPATEVDSPLAPGDDVKITILSGRHGEGGSKYSIRGKQYRIQQSGHIIVPGINQPANIAGTTEQAKEAILSSLRAHLGRQFGAMQFRVVVERVDDQANEGVAEDPAEYIEGFDPVESSDAEVE